MNKLSKLLHKPPFCKLTWLKNVVFQNGVSFFIKKEEGVKFNLGEFVQQQPPLLDEELAEGKEDPPWGGANFTPFV